MASPAPRATRRRRSSAAIPTPFVHGPETSAETLAISKRRPRAKIAAVQIDVLNHHKSGRKIWIHADGQPIFDDAGKVANYIVIQIDITKRKRWKKSCAIPARRPKKPAAQKALFLANMSHELRARP